MSSNTGVRGPWTLPAALATAALASGALVVFGPPPDGPVSFPLTVPLLLAAAVAARILPGRIGAGVGLAAVVLAVAAAVTALAPQAEDGLTAVAIGIRVLQFAALAVAAYAGIRQVVRPPRDTDGPRRDWTRPLQITALLCLSAIGAELLAAYSDNTGDPGGVAFAVVFFAALYGAPALLARELVRRRGWAWPSLLLLYAALGTAQACLIDQSLFSADYQGYEGWEEIREATLIPPLGISAYNAFSFIVGHIVYSFAAPVALAEAWAPQRAREPWLGRVGTVVAALAYAGAAALIVSDPESRSGSPLQLTVAAGIVAAFVVAAVLIGRRATAGPAEAGRPPRPTRRLPLWPVFAAALLVAFALDLSPQSWGGVLLSLAAISAFAVALLAAAKTRDWTIRHSAAAALAFLLARGLMAFTYFPLLGDVAPLPKYTHNAVMLLAVLAAGWFALRGKRAPR
ncbi:hypothetical protein O4J56_02325 [Nocardiopsis sp. RSe5-2]|uniref:Uncharacterized protein n=1 Tax=Nocardiopsis endophytica TaxID=3018445 RepID=A0ABT4TXQ5_9ACTN|nr:hypothetical protein [Nocardiopsis endophytica]MDA2809463.1 hypothetical protein [Nocardiopsis endophytica]